MHDALLPRTPQALLSRIQAGLHSGTRAATLHTAYPGRHVEERGQAQGACRRSRPVRRLCWTSGGYPSALECHPPLMRLHRCGAHCGSEVRPAYTAYPAHPLASCHGTWRLPERRRGTALHGHLPLSGPLARGSSLAIPGQPRRLRTPRRGLRGCLDVLEALLDVSHVQLHKALQLLLKVNESPEIRKPRNQNANLNYVYCSPACLEAHA